jgi:hypothetical protein
VPPQLLCELLRAQGQVLDPDEIQQSTSMDRDTPPPSSIERAPHKPHIAAASRVPNSATTFDNR